ncbi:hypothetical protein Y032_0313g2187 [Ancylostoma ceylanicum]|uniref:Uncharacterized protein n=1 Tax=Ancylostoma ceylanicum TaxID=53326 RepID=A0A016S2B2_9BILA|nr:hypothetical protein Y032_0313g2187 [Ancylostoma ceylanicum]
MASQTTSLRNHTFCSENSQDSKGLADRRDPGVRLSNVPGAWRQPGRSDDRQPPGALSPVPLCLPTHYVGVASERGWGQLGHALSSIDVDLPTSNRKPMLF